MFSIAPTIKDVAKLAGVSHGTVSNVLNGYKSVNSKIVKRVEAAIRELGYQPNLKASSMRSSRSHCIGVLLPNITDNIHINICDGVERIASDAGYSVSLYISNGSPETEEELLLRMQQQRVDGAVILSCISNKTKVFDDLLKSGTELVFIRRKPDFLKEAVFFGIDERQVIFNITTSLLKKGWKEITLLTGREDYSNEKECVMGFREALAASGQFNKKNTRLLNNCYKAIQTANEGKESAFKAAVQLIHGEKKTRAFITTCPENAKGIQSAVNMFNLNSSLILFLDNDSWVKEAAHNPQIRVSQQYYQSGEEAVKKLLLMIEAPNPGKAETKIFPAMPAPPIPSPPIPPSEKQDQNERLPRRGEKALRVLMLENASSVASKMMKSVFSEETGIPVEIDTLPYESMYGAIFDKNNRARYDIMQINIPWIAEVIRQGLLIPLENILGKDNIIHSTFSPEILEQHGLFAGHMYLAPFLIGTQLLFYRKDLFNDLRIRRLYYERNKTSLEVPATWKDYDKVAEFFTRTRNPESPVPFGTTLGGPSGSYYFMPRLWEKSLSLFLKFPNEPNAAFLNSIEETLSWYKAAFAYADPSAKDWDQTEQANQFCRGSAAMMVIYTAHFTDHVYQHESTINKENIGFAALPNQTSVLGGWSLGVSAESDKLPQAKNFLEWIFKDSNILLHNILGGSIPSVNTFNSHEIKKIYPWLTFCSGNVFTARRMTDNEVQWIPQWEFECVIENILGLLINNKINEKKAAEEIWKKLAEKRKIYHKEKLFIDN